ncbi:class I SAM-dependent methyltransferase [Myroides injenensis]|uniref:class I SAM-dependent methyltransferase n=1 Tax=Myroides injenensis TaxID=1183151 RepID=UPI000289BA4F|nr:class I SAM-dependent methyltransferase [Myroides injenensis]
MKINANEKYIEVEDYSISHEKFQLYLDPDLHLLKTVPQPIFEKIGEYYKSEDYISHTDSKRNLFEKVYHIVKRKAIQNKIDLIESFSNAKGKLLDIGCGTGDFIFEANKRGWKVCGFEPNASASSLAKEKGLSLLESTENIDSNSLDVVTMWHVLEHVHDLDKQIRELYRLLKPGGNLIIAVPNYNSYDAKYYGKYWAAYDVPRHLWHFSQKSIPLLFEPYLFSHIETCPMLFDSFYVSLLSEKYKTGKQNWLKAFWIGLKSNIEARQNLEYSSLIYILKKV